jgi:phosphoglycolate phosphatase-like HAD superfamily hydrolase
MHTEGGVTIDSDIQTIIWDLDGTLFDSFEAYGTCFNQVMRMRGMEEVSEAMLRDNHHGSLEDSICSMLQQTNQEPTQAELLEILEAFHILDDAAMGEPDRYLFDDALILATAVSQKLIRQIVVTNRVGGAARQQGSPQNIVSASRLNGLIEMVVSRESTPYKKPQAELLHTHFGSDLSVLGNIVVFGDQFVDAEFARNIGARAVLVNRTGTIAHLDSVTDWQEFTTIVPSFAHVAV